MLEIPESFNSIFAALFAAVLTVVIMCVANLMHAMMAEANRERMAKRCIQLGGHQWDRKPDGRLICERCHTTFRMHAL